MTVNTMVYLRALLEKNCLAFASKLPLLKACAIGLFVGRYWRARSLEKP
ncbi:MAG: hypothetical protein MUE44_15850 [Oscillatoriaceae cyanobacterium Prado104]|nr:hypothetical protein [Oscillatoriaceae cyanobacterium Prado104]